MTTGESDGRPQGLSVAVVTPYFKESPATLQRCLASVSAQTYPRVIHYMVADGFPQTALLAQWPGVRHVQLPNAHANFGCTPRGIGAQCALADGVDVVCFLDADNLLEPEHVATVVQTVAQAQAAGVALDAVGVALLRLFGTTPEVSYGPIFGLQQLARAVELGLGVDAPQGMRFITDDAASATYADRLREILLV